MQQHISTRSRNTPRTGKQKRCCVVFEFSCSPAARSGFRSEMAERVLRQFEADRSIPEVRSLRPASVGCVRVDQVVLRPVELRRVPLRQALHVKSLAASTVVTRPAPVLHSRSGIPRLFASRTESPRSILVSPMSHIKRAASARLVQRLSERLASLSSRQVPVRQVQVRQVAVCQLHAFGSASDPVGLEVLRQRPVASRLV